MSATAAMAVWFGLALATGLGMLAAYRLFGPRRRTAEKAGAYECGVTPAQDARDRVHVRFYLVAILFILFDVETVFLLPWALVYRKLGLFGLAEMALFLGLLTFGLYYAWRRGALEWD